MRLNRIQLQEGHHFYLLRLNEGRIPSGNLIIECIHKTLVPFETQTQSLKSGLGERRMGNVFENFLRRLNGKK